MKVGILTYHFSENYGALFQAYALRQWFLNQGHEAEFINYHPEYVESGGNIQLNNLFSRKNLKVVYLKLSELRRKYFGNRQQQHNFDRFRSDYLGVKEPEYKGIEELEYSFPNYDLFVCGSDQIWNPSEQYGLDPVYFLKFKSLNHQARRISYAPSFGRGEIDAEYHNELASLINNLDGVSVRELSGVSLIRKIANVEAACVPDPTLLLSDYSNIMRPYPTQSGKHVFCYGLRSRSVIGDVAETVAKELGASLYSPYNPHRRWKEIGETVYPCPRQWLYLMYTAEFVVTNSFHGTALSILLNKPFVVVGLQGHKSSFNERVLNLLELTGLQCRFLNRKNASDINSILSTSINWEIVNNAVSDLRLNGEIYLGKQLFLVAENGKS